jgi:hypothetical protein
MRASAIVIQHVRQEYVAQVSLAEDDDIIKAFPSDRADQPFSMLEIVTQYSWSRMPMARSRTATALGSSLIARRRAWHRMCAVPRRAQNTRKSPFHAASSSNVITDIAYHSESCACARSRFVLIWRNVNRNPRRSPRRRRPQHRAMRVGKVPRAVTHVSGTIRLSLGRQKVVCRCCTPAKGDIFCAIVHLARMTEDGA